MDHTKINRILRFSLSCSICQLLIACNAEFVEKASPRPPAVDSVIAAVEDPAVPMVSVGAPAVATGDQNTTFVFTVTYAGADSIHLTQDKVMIITTGSVVCDAPVAITNGDTASPIVSVSHCVGDGTVAIAISAGSASNGAGADAGFAGGATAIVSLTCPIGYIPVVHDHAYGGTDFCVMKYEAKLLYNGVLELDGNADNNALHDWSAQYGGVNQSSFKAISLAQGQPWTYISRGDAANAGPAGALEACQSLGAGYDLISNDQWQTIARNIEMVNTNWAENVIGGTSSGSIGTDANQINQGHSEQLLNQTLAAATDDSAGCVGTGQALNPGADDSCPGGWNIRKRTHALSNGAVIWDFSGNAEEWVRDTNPDADFGVEAFFSQVTDLSHAMAHALKGGTTAAARNAKAQFGPMGDYTSLNSGNYGGLGKGLLDAGGYGYPVIARGGSVFDPDLGATGIFAMNGWNTTIDRSERQSFRCAYIPPVDPPVQTGFEKVQVGNNYIATAHANHNLHVEIDCDDGAVDGHYWGMTPVIDGRRLDGALWGDDFGLITPDFDAGSIQCVGVEAAGDRLIVRFDAGSYRNLKAGPDVPDLPVPTYAEFYVDNNRNLVVELEGIYYLLFNKVNTALDITAGGLGYTLNYDASSADAVTYYDSVTAVNVSDSIFGDFLIETSIDRLQVQVRTVDPRFEFDLDHSYTEMGQQSVSSRITFY
ncbi:MAG: hypothetical protein R3F42_08930 [Pseudomonadota bacterium]